MGSDALPIMTFCSTTGLSADSLSHINQCRLFLQVYFLFKMTNNSSTPIKLHMKQGM